MSGPADVGPEPGNDANKYPRKVMKAWRECLYRRLRAHLVRKKKAPAAVRSASLAQPPAPSSTGRPARSR